LLSVMENGGEGGVHLGSVDGVGRERGKPGKGGKMGPKTSHTETGFTYWHRKENLQDHETSLLEPAVRHMERARRFCEVGDEVPPAMNYQVQQGVEEKEAKLSPALEWRKLGKGEGGP